MKGISLQTVIASEKSSLLLLNLDEGPQNFDKLLVSLRTNKKQLLSIIGLLEQYYLITEENGIYRLTRIGELIAEKLKPLLRMEEFMNSADGYWRNRKLDFIPPPLLKRLHEIGPCTVVQPHFTEIYDYNKEAHEISKCSKSFNMVAAGLHPSFPDLFSDLIDGGVNLSLIFDGYLFDKLKRDNYDELQKFLNNRQVALHLYPQKMQFLSFKVNDSCLVLKLLNDNGEYDHRQLMCHSPNAVEWGKDLFDYYIKDSTVITSILI